MKSRVLGYQLNGVGANKVSVGVHVCVSPRAHQLPRNVTLYVHVTVPFALNHLDASDHSL
jgi:hypothetical protein